MLVIGSQHLVSQQQNNQWRFGVGSAIDFNTTPPTYPTGTALPTIDPPIQTGSYIEGTASVADRTTGQLLFYTDGQTVWNALNQPMPNGTGLDGSDFLSSYQGAIIVPVPNSCTRYYILCSDDAEEQRQGITYSLVDMTLDNGRGDVVPGQKAISLYTNVSEMLMAYPDTAGNGYWVITNAASESNPKLASFYVSTSGIIPYPLAISDMLAFSFSGKINPQGTKFVGVGNTGFDIYDFSPISGQVSNPISIDFPLVNDLLKYFEFSPDGNYLYASGDNNFYQFNLSSNNPATILASATAITFGDPASYYATPQLGPDGNLYVVKSPFIYRIENPNNPAATLGPITQLPQSVTTMNTLPQWIYTLPVISASFAYSQSAYSNALNTQQTPVLNGPPGGVFTASPAGLSVNSLSGAINPSESQPGIYTITYSLGATTACNPATATVEIQGNVLTFTCFEFPPLADAPVFFTVPDSVTRISVKMWGAAGGGGPLFTDAGGGGGYTAFELDVTPGETFEISVGRGGIAANGGIGGAGGWPGGGNGGSGNLKEAPLGGDSLEVGGGGGGGGATLFRRVSDGVLLAAAGAGGGGTQGRVGGPAGGLEGQYTAINNVFNQFGFGGTQTSGGAPAQNTFVANSVIGTAGSSLQGGDGATDLNPDNFRKGGGGGGSGYFGGGGGSAYDANGFGVGSSGGGGSGYLQCSNCAELSGVLLGSDDFSGAPANAGDPLLWLYPGTGTGTPNNNGGGGLVQICAIDVCTPSFATLDTTSCSPFTNELGNSFDSTGTYTYALLAASGCDSIVTLNLTIHSVSGLQNIFSCGPYTTEEGTVYNASTVFTTTVQAVGGCDSIITNNLTVFNPAPINATPEIVSIALGDSVQLNASGGVTYSWSPTESLSCSNCASPLAFPSQGTTYVVAVTNSAGCTQSDTLRVEVDIICNEVFIPTIFSPNSKGPQANETFCVFSDCVEQFKLVIHNRWGERIFESEDINQCWDGTFKGEEAATGVYAYNVYLKQLDGRVLSKAGTVELVK
jgi:gliding motility-associated-like protein